MIPVCPLHQQLQAIKDFQNHQWKRETWWWDGKVDEAIKTKFARFRSYKALVKAGRLSEANEAKGAYKEAKRLAKRVVWQAKLDAEKGKFANILLNDRSVFKLSKQHPIV